MTAITPPEYENLEPFISIDEINNMARRFKIQNVDLYPVCVGRATKRDITVYYLIVESHRLREFRRLVFEESCRRGMCPSNMDLDGYHFHVTLGYKGHDLHPADNIHKSPRTCFAGLNVVGDIS